MSDATVVAQEIQDLATAVGEVAGAIREHQLAAPVVNVSVPEQAAPTVTVNVPEQAAPVVNLPQAAAPVVNVSVPEQPAPVVNVSASPVSVSPVINVERTDPQMYEVTVTDRDASGYIRQFVIVPVYG